MIDWHVRWSQHKSSVVPLCLVVHWCPHIVPHEGLPKVGQHLRVSAGSWHLANEVGVWCMNFTKRECWDLELPVSQSLVMGGPVMSHARVLV
jgi:hypothetical protein